MLMQFLRYFYMPHVYIEIYKIVQKIPKGRVLTYGVISHMIGGRMSAQGVGWALKALGSKKRLTDTSSKKRKSTAEIKTSSKKELAARGKNSNDENHFDFASVPWQRVVNAQGGMSTLKLADIPPGLQQSLLEAEGVVFNDEGTLDLNKYLWVEGMKNSTP